MTGEYPHDHGPVRKGRPALRARRRPHHDGADGAVPTRPQRFHNTDGTHLGTAFGGTPESMNEFTRLEQFAKLQKPPQIKFKDLEAAGQFAHHLQHPADEGARRFLPRHRCFGADLRHAPVRQQGPAVPVQGGRAEEPSVNIYGAVHHHDAPRGDVFEDTVTVDAPPEHAARVRQAQVHLSEDDPAGAGHLPAECRWPRTSGRQHEQLRGGRHRAPPGSGQAQQQHPDAGGRDREGPHARASAPASS